MCLATCFAKKIVRQPMAYDCWWRRLCAAGALDSMVLREFLLDKIALLATHFEYSGLGGGRLAGSIAAMVGKLNGTIFFMGKKKSKS